MHTFFVPDLCVRNRDAIRAYDYDICRNPADLAIGVRAARNNPSAPCRCARNGAVVPLVVKVRDSLGYRKGGSEETRLNHTSDTDGDTKREALLISGERRAGCKNDGELSALNRSRLR